MKPSFGYCAIREATRLADTSSLRWPCDRLEPAKEGASLGTFLGLLQRAMAGRCWFQNSVASCSRLREAVVEERGAVEALGVPASSSSLPSSFSSSSSSSDTS